MFSKFEVMIAAVSILFVAVALYLVQLETNLLTTSVAQPATVVVGQGLAVVPSESTAAAVVAPEVIIAAMKIDDITVGTGPAAKNGDTVAVHYVGTVTDGTEFDNSHKRGAPIEFTLGSGQVIAGWEEGILGMQVGGERVLVIPPEKAYGDAGIGPIPGGATLTFTVSLMEIK